MRLEESHRQDLNRQNLEHRQIMERHAAEQQSIREDLRKELAQVHIEKFSAMAAELSHVHKVRTGTQPLNYLLIKEWSTGKKKNLLLTFISMFLCILQTELAAQKEALDKEHCRALETLKKQVLTHSSLLLLLPNLSKS